MNFPLGCPACKRGVLYDITSRLAQALGVKQTKCNRCGAVYAAKIGADIP